MGQWLEPMQGPKGRSIPVSFYSLWHGLQGVRSKQIPAKICVYILEAKEQPACCVALPIQRPEDR